MPARAWGFKSPLGHGFKIETKAPVSGNAVGALRFPEVGMTPLVVPNPGYRGLPGRRQPGMIRAMSELSAAQERRRLARQHVLDVWPKDIAVEDMTAEQLADIQEAEIQVEFADQAYLELQAKLTQTESSDTDS